MPKRWMILAAAMFGFVAAPVPVWAATIDVATVNLSLLGDDCRADQTSDEQQDSCIAQFTLTFIWLDGLAPGPAPAPVVSGSFTVDSVLYDFLPVGDGEPGNPGLVDIFSPTTGVPVTASARLSFVFGGVDYDLDEQLFSLAGLFDVTGAVAPGGETLTFVAAIPSAVPEPSTLATATLGLVLLGLLVVGRHSAQC